MTYPLARTLLPGLISLGLGLAACGDDLKPMADAGLQRTTRLEILNPPGDSIGLSFSEATTLRVRYLDDQGQIIVGGAAQFKLLSSSGESTGGASLSAASSVTDVFGIARVDLLAGAERVNFRVEVSAPQAPPVLFYIQVSAQGFANLQIRSAHEGPRDPSIYDRIQLRIYNQPLVNCLSLEVDDLPVSFFPARTQSVVGERSTFANLAADESYTVIGWGELEGGRPLAAGCLDLAADKLRSGTTFEASLAIVDRSYELSVPLFLDTAIDLSPLRDLLPGQAQWQELACPRGRAQLLLDCLADAQVSDGNMDCDGESASPLSLAMAPRRGLLDASDCRGPVDSDGAASIDALLDQALGGWPSDAELLSLHQGRFSALDTLGLRSRVLASSGAITSHRLFEASLGAFSADLVDSDRPVIEVTAVPLSLDAAPLLNLGSHGFTLRYGELAAQAYEELALAPANISMRGEALGSELIDGIVIGAATGCTALESFVCNELALPAACANSCPSVAAPLNVLLAQWLAELVTTGIDYRFALEAEIVDSDNDLIIDGLVAGPDQVDAELDTAGGALSVPATVTGSSN